MKQYLTQSKYLLTVIPFLIVLILLSGCAAHLREAFEKVTADDIEKNKGTAIAVGQRTFDLPIKILMKACITAFSNKNLSSPIWL